MKIKICRVTDIDSAKMLVWQGVDYLGFHIIDCGETFKSKNFKFIVNYLKRNLKRVFKTLCQSRFIEQRDH
jgi:hypothetical protein